MRRAEAARGGAASELGVMDAETVFANGLVELISPYSYIAPQGHWADDEVRLCKVQEDRRKITLANYKLLELAIRRCSEKLFVTFSGSAVSDMRMRISDLYNTLWDLCIENKRMGLDCRIIVGLDGMKTKVGWSNDTQYSMVVILTRTGCCRKISSMSIS